MPSNHPIEQEELMAYLDGELPVDRASAAAGHLERCRECQGLAADFESVSRRLTAWQVEPSDSAIPQAISAELDRKKQKTDRVGWWNRRWVWIAVGSGACIVVLVLLPMLQLRPRYRLNRMQEQQVSLLQAPSRAVAIDAIRAHIPMIVRTAQLTLTTSEFDKARADLEDILKRHNGYLGQLNVSAPAGAGRTLDATLRIPADQRDAAVAEVKKLGRVESETQSGEEVTQQYVDLEARLSNARNTEQRLTEMLRQRTGKLADVLAVELEIGRVREEIEKMEAERKGLANRVDFLTLDVKLTENYKAQVDVAPGSILGRLRNASIAGYRSLVEGVVTVVLLLLSYGPSILIWGTVLFFPARIAWRRLRRS
jgi:hypothetical protein